MVNQGLLEVNFNIKNNIDLNNAFSSENVKNPLLKSISGNISAKDANSLENLAGGNTALQHIDTIRTNSSNTSLKEALNNLPNLKYIRLEGSYESKGNSFDNNTNLQKVDLSESLQVKPKDFKANESLKTLPKLDFSNPDLTDIITNDTELKPTTIDLSNQNNTIKLGIHGDSTHQLGNLEFVKVSTEAPFDSATSPQINVSYTGLGRSALINLFKSMPYNVGYTVVGSPTIVDGVASGFSSSNYLDIQKFTGYNSDFEFNVAFSTSDTTPTCGLLSGSSYLYGGILIVDNKARFSARIQAETTQTFTVSSNVSLSTNTSYIANAKREGNVLTLKLYKNGVLEDTATGDLTDVILSSNIAAIRIGRNANGSFNGSIDLNNTYIKVNGVPWFTGKAAMTKTCSVVGCTGTSSLTAEDKAIVTGKGWLLVTTVS